MNEDSELLKEIEAKILMLSNCERQRLADRMLADALRETGTTLTIDWEKGGEP